MGIEQYRSVLALRAIRRVLWLSLVVRIPLWAGSVVLTLHVVTHLHRSYSAAGLLVGVATVTLALSAPWLGAGSTGSGCAPPSGRAWWS